MSETKSTAELLKPLEMPAMGLAAVGVLAGGAGFFAAREEFFHAYLIGFLFCAGLALGSLVLLLLHHMFGAGWGFSIQRPLEAGTRTLPLIAVLFLPVALGMHHIYEWTHADVVAKDHLLQHKTPYLNVPFFFGRAAIYFLVWFALMWLFNKWSRELDATGDARIAERMRNSTAPGLLLFGLTASFASVDWIMSLEPHWFSTIFGIITIVGQILGTLALMSIVARFLVEGEPYEGTVGSKQFHDLGNLMLAFTMIWSYVSISQFLILWSGNVPETITWYKSRTSNGWENVAVTLALFSFAVPFLFLLMRSTKRRAGALARVAALLLAMRLVELFWIVKPTFHPQGVAVHWLDVLLPLGMFGVWLTLFLRQMKARPVLPQRDPRLVEAFAHGEEHH